MYDIKANFLNCRMNPVSEASEKHKDELLACQQEVLRLQERVRLLEEGQVNDLTQAVNERITGTTSKEIEGINPK